MDRNKVMVQVRAGEKGRTVGNMEFLYEEFKCFWQHTESVFEWDGLYLVDYILRYDEPAKLRESYNSELEMAIKRDELSKRSSKWPGSRLKKILDKPFFMRYYCFHKLVFDFGRMLGGITLDCGSRGFRFES